MNLHNSDLIQFVFIILEIFLVVEELLMLTTF